MSTLNLYTIDIIRDNGSTHFTVQALLTDDEKAKVAAWLASVTATHIGATSGTITLSSTGNPVNFDTLVGALEKQIPTTGKPNIHPSLR